MIMLIIKTILVLSVLSVLFYFFSKKIKIITLCLIFACGIILMSIPSVRITSAKIVYALISPSDFYDFIGLESFNFSKIGFSKKILLNPKYPGTYNIFMFAEKGIPKTNLFDSILKIEFYSDGRFIYENTFTSCNKKSAKVNKIKYQKHFFRPLFELPVKNQYSNKLEIKVTVIKGEKSLERYDKETKIGVKMAY